MIQNYSGLGITISFNQFIDEATPGDGSFGDDVDASFPISDNQLFTDQLKAQLKAQNISCFIWRGETVSVSGKSVTTSSGQSQLVAWSDSPMAELRAYLNSEINAYYEINAIQNRLFYVSSIESASARDFTVRTAVGVVKKMVELIRWQNRDDLYCLKSLDVKPFLALQGALGLQFGYGDDIEPEDLRDLDLEKLWRFLVLKLDIDQINEKYCQDNGRHITKGIIKGKQYKSHSVFWFWPSAFDSLLKIINILGIDEYCDHMGTVTQQGNKKEKIKISKPGLEKIIFFLNQYCKDRLIRDHELHAKGML